jgi:A/G-specific adenine glycosylase
MDIRALRNVLIFWGRRHFRAFPWRLTDDPYRILMVEVMLHRTQASQVLPVYQRFVGRYPDIPAFTQASRAELRDLLYPLGLYWRIDLIHAMGDQLRSRFGAQVPKERAELESLPGVSQYIACAVRCFSWNLPEPLIDTNTIRVVGRLFGLEVKDSSRRNRHFRQLIESLVDPEQPKDYNYALLDLAQLVCQRRQPPKCADCPIQQYCVHGTDTPGPQEAA